MKQFELIVRAVIIRRNRILLCRASRAGTRSFFFPGGHVKFGERAADALRRELTEEIGFQPRASRFIGVVENIFRSGKNHHEINLVFAVRLPAAPVRTRENHIAFSWVEIEKFRRVRVLPRSLARCVLRWIDNGKLLWSGVRDF